MVIWAGRIMVIQGIVHLVITGVLSAGYFDEWVSGALWFPANGLSVLPPEAGAFWLVLGSYGVPLLLLGAMVIRLGRHGQRPPLVVAWIYGLWGVVCAVIFVPSPFITTLIPFWLLLADARRGTRDREAVG